MNNGTVNKRMKRFYFKTFTKEKFTKVLIIEGISIQSLKFTKKEFLEEQLLVQLIATFQKYQNILISAYNQQFVKSPLILKI